MKRRRTLLLLPLIAAVAFSGSLAVLAQDPNVEKAQEFIKLLENKQFHKAYLRLDSNLGFKLKSGEKLAGAWNNLVRKAGAFEEFRSQDVEVLNGNGMTYHLVKQLCKFENGLVNIMVALDGRGTVADFKFSNYDGPPVPVEEETDKKPAPDNGTASNSEAPPPPAGGDNPA